MANNLYRGKRVLIFGLGLNQGGVGAAKFFAKLGAKVRVTDLKTADVLQHSLQQLKDFPGIKYILGGHREEDFDWAELVIRNPAIKPSNKFLEYAKLKDKEIETDIGIMLRFIKPSQIIGITGTKGKSTTFSLIYEILKAAGKKVVFGGNIGKSPLDILDYIYEKTLLVLELSSFQLEAFEKHKVSPKWAVITNIFPDHLNYYNTMEEYINAKRAIAKYQTKNDFLFIQKDDPVTNTISFLDGLPGQKYLFSNADLPENFSPILIGNHNKLNIAAALAVARQLGVNSELALDIAVNFKGVEFRIQLIKTWQGIKIYNDTAATNPEAAIAALNSLPGSILIAGGMDKNLQFEEFAKAIDKNAKKVFFIEGDATEKIIELMKNKSLIKGKYNNFETILKEIKKEATPVDIILFSPGATSFNLFQNEFDRGRKFNAAVTQVFGG